MKTLLCTSFALVAFAANSVLCRLALKGGEIDPASFTVVRLLAGAIVLALVIQLRGGGGGWRHRGSWPAAAMLFAYAISFSLAYVSLDAGTGALVLFGAVQLSMVLVGYFRGRKLRPLEWLGLATASGGIVYLVLPGLSTPSASGFLLMAVAGTAWGLYTLIGKGSKHPLADTAGNFVRTIPLVALLAVVATAHVELSAAGVLLAVASGSLASGIGYAAWYLALDGLSETEAAVVQLTVPIIAALGGVIFVSESLSLRLLVATVLVLGGILLVKKTPRGQTLADRKATGEGGREG